MIYTEGETSVNTSLVTGFDIFRRCTYKLSYIYLCKRFKTDILLKDLKLLYVNV